MRKVAVISGKGGTGKTTVAASLAQLVENKLIADCDVDAPNLHLLLAGDCLSRQEFRGAKEAVIDPAACIACGRCREVCRFEAVNPDYTINGRNCEGCGACVVVCPQQAVHLEEVKTGETYVTRAAPGIFAHARLDCGVEGSGKLVTAVRENAMANRTGEEWLVIDGAPGIGCAVIASITGCDAVLVVTEPTLSGQMDMERVLAASDHFRIPAAVCINKYDLNLEVTGAIEDFCRGNGYHLAGKIPFDPAVVDALRQLKTPLEVGSPAGEEIRNIWWNLVAFLDNKEE